MDTSSSGGDEASAAEQPPNENDKRVFQLLCSDEKIVEIQGYVACTCTTLKNLIEGNERKYTG